MRVTILALFLSTGVAAMCQSMAPEAPDNARENSQHIAPRMDCKSALPDFSMFSFAPLKGEPQSGLPAKWHWNDGQADSKNRFQYQFAGAVGQINSKNTFNFSISNSAVQTCTLVAQNSQPISSEMPFARWPNAKLAPIPTQWPNTKFKPIPTEWPNLKIVPITSQQSTTPTQ